MTTTWGLSYLYAGISRILLTATRSYAICPQRKCVLAAERAAGGGMVFSGQSATMAFQPLEITQDGTHFYVIGTTGVEKHTMAAVPVFANLFSFDAGLGRFIFSEGSYLVVPDGKSGVQTISRTTGAVTVSLPGVLNEIHAGCYDTANRRLWLFDQNRAKGVSIQVGTAGQLTYASSFSIPNCKNIVRAVFDSTAALLFIVNDHRIVSFSTAAWDEPVVSVDYGANKLTYTDFAKIGTNQYWIGTAEPSNADAVPGPFGQQFGAWDSVNSEMQIACPKMSLWTVNDAIPYWTITTIPEIIITPPPVVVPVVPPYVPPVVTPAAPVITSSLTASVIEDTLFSYTITATGTGPIYYDVVSPPPWLTGINHITGVITGTPPDPATVNVTITATNAGGTDTETLAVTVVAAVGDNTGVYTNGAIEGAYVGGTLVYVVGSFTSVTDPSGTVTRNRAACLNVSTGRWTAWNPNISATAYIVHKHRGYVYIGTRTAAPTFGGASVSYGARVDATTGVRDATWAPSFNGQLNAFSSDDDIDLIVCGNFTTVNASARPCVCKFVDTSLSSWLVAASDGNTLATHAGSPVSSIQSVVKSGGSVMLIAASLRCTRTAGGYWCGAWAVASNSTGTLAQMSEGFPLSNVLGPSGQSVHTSGGSVVVTWITSLGGSAINTLPTAVDTGKDMYATVSLTFGGVTTPKVNFLGTGGNLSGACQTSAGDMLIGGDYSGYTGYPNDRNLVKWNPSSGFLDSAFTFYLRQNATAKGSNQPLNGVKPIVGDAVVAYGSFGSVGGNHQYDGVVFQNILILNSLTGARL